MMFEKKAEEYAEGMAKYYESAHDSIPSQFEKYLRNAVKFGYNKANEWHFIKDGDYPKDKKPVLCIIGDFDEESYDVGYYHDKESGEPWHFETYDLPDDDGDNAWGVSAWQEINPPKVKQKE